MAITEQYAAVEPTRAEIDAQHTPTVLEFGAPWCGYCQAAQPLLAEAFASHPRVVHVKVEDGKGRPLGRSFRVTLWPTLIFLRAGVEITRLVRPATAQAIHEALEKIDDGARTAG